MSSIYDYLEQGKMFAWDLRSLIDKAYWPEIDSKPYAQLLCKNIIRILDEPEPPLFTGRKRKLFDDDQCFSDVSSSNTAMSKRGAKKNLMNCEDDLKWKMYGSKNIKNENYPSECSSYSKATKPKRLNKKKQQEMLKNWENVEDGSEWRKYGQKEIEGKNYLRFADDYSDSKATKSETLNKKNLHEMTNWFIVKKEKDEDGLKWGNYGSEKIENEYYPKLAEYKNLAEEKPMMNWIVVAKEKADDGLKWRKYGSKKIKNGNHPRHYYVCAYKGCPAKKQIEQTDDDEHVKIFYNQHHNCKNFGPLNGLGLLESDPSSSN